MLYQLSHFRLPSHYAELDGVVKTGGGPWEAGLDRLNKFTSISPHEFRSQQELLGTEAQ